MVTVKLCDLLAGSFLPPTFPVNLSVTGEGAGSGVAVGVFVGVKVGVGVGVLVGAGVGVFGAGVDVPTGVDVAVGVVVEVGAGVFVAVGVGAGAPPAIATAARAFTRPAPYSLLEPMLFALSRRMDSAAEAERPGFAPKISATTPAATGDASEVPLAPM